MINRIGDPFFKLLLTLSVFLGSFLCLTAGLYAQEEKSVRIYHMAGTDFALSLYGERTFFQEGEISGRGIALERSGIIHTGPGTFLEAQLYPSGTLIKVSENTSLIYNGVDETGKFQDFGLLYGRVRVVTGKETDFIVIRGGGVSVKIKDGDFGVDYLLEQSELNSTPQPLFTISAIRGSAEIYPYGMGASSPFFGGVNVVDINEGECFSLDISSFHTVAEKKPIDRDTLIYWRFYKFSALPPIFVPRSRVEIEIPDLVSTPIQPVTQINVVRSFESGNKTRNIILGIGLALTASAVATQVITHPQREFISNADLSRNLYNIAYVPMGLGLISLLGGILYNPSR